MSRKRLRFGLGACHPGCPAGSVPRVLLATIKKPCEGPPGPPRACPHLIVLVLVAVLVLDSHVFSRTKDEDEHEEEGQIVAGTPYLIVLVLALDSHVFSSRRGSSPKNRSSGFSKQRLREFRMCRKGLEPYAPSH